MEYSEALKKYEELVAHFPAIQRKGKANPYTSLNGHMFSFLDKEARLSLRFSDEGQKEFMEKHNAPLSIQYGSVMRGYAVVPLDLQKDIEALKPYFAQSVAFISSLKPKPTTKKK
ncbi:MAG: hypothetical protein KDC83_07075 [Flavobacteriales bacterium]|nr:hypothetical protein [Flavobacteriales bacterium]